MEISGINTPVENSDLIELLGTFVRYRTPI
jgi:hypothetical protein